MIRIAISIQLNYDIDPTDSDFFFNIHAATSAPKLLTA
jgi:hypothetical protein